MISRRTAELALIGLDVAMDTVLKRSRHNGGAVMSPDLERALVELHAAAAVSPERQEWTQTPPPTAQLLSVMEAARRSGVSTRTIERRAAAGTLPANRVGRSWQIVWNEGNAMPEQTRKATPEAPPRYRVTAAFITVKTGALAGIIPGRGGYTVVGIYKNGLLPADAPAEDVERLLRKGVIEAVAA